MRYDVKVAATFLRPLRGTVATLTEAMKALNATVKISDSHSTDASMTVDAWSLPEAIDVGLDAWVEALRSAGDGMAAMSVSAVRAE